MKSSREAKRQSRLEWDESVVQNTVSQKTRCMDLGVCFCNLLEALGESFLVLAALETGLKIDGFLVQ